MKGSDKSSYFHVCTDGNSLPWMFQDEKDFIAGVNRIAICCIKVKIKVIAYVLMDNHVHFLLYGTSTQCTTFINLYKRLTGRWILTRYGISGHMKLLPTEIIPIKSMEALLNTIAYIDRNPLIAGYRYMHNEYPWGSSKYIFRNSPSNTPTENGSLRKISSITRRNQRKIFNTKVTFPDNWTISESGIILPESYLDISTLESLFKTPIKYSYFLSKKLEGTIEEEFENAQKLFIPDKELRENVKNLVQQNHGDKTITELTIDERITLAKKLKHEYNSPIKQISRMLHLDPAILKKFV